MFQMVISFETFFSVGKCFRKFNCVRECLENLIYSKHFILLYFLRMFQTVKLFETISRLFCGMLQISVLNATFSSVLKVIADHRQPSNIDF
jgi:hypothetical protein